MRPGASWGYCWIQLVELKQQWNSVLWLDPPGRTGTGDETGFQSCAGWDIWPPRSGCSLLETSSDTKDTSCSSIVDASISWVAAVGMGVAVVAEEGDAIASGRRDGWWAGDAEPPSKAALCLLGRWGEKETIASKAWLDGRLDLWERRGRIYRKQENNNKNRELTRNVNYKKHENLGHGCQQFCCTNHKQKEQSVWNYSYLKSERH